MEIFMLGDGWQCKLVWAGFGVLCIVVIESFIRVKNRILYGKLQNSVYPKDIRCKCKSKWIILNEIRDELWTGYCIKCHKLWVKDLRHRECFAQWFPKEDWDKANREFERRY